LYDTRHLTVVLKRLDDLLQPEAHLAPRPDHRNPAFGCPAVHGPARDPQALRHAIDVRQDRGVVVHRRFVGVAWRLGVMTALVAERIKRVQTGGAPHHRHSQRAVWPHLRHRTKMPGTLDGSW